MFAVTGYPLAGKDIVNQGNNHPQLKTGKKGRKNHAYNRHYKNPFIGGY